jgi:hypothetical protein
MSNIVNVYAQKNLEARKLGEKFHHTFGVSLYPYWDIITGFKIVEFDEYLKVPDGQSTKQFITKKYNKVAADLIERLISL